MAIGKGGQDMENAHPRRPAVAVGPLSAARFEENVPSKIDLEPAVADAWHEVLGISGVGPADDFFTLGGESLGAMRVCNRLGEVVGTRIPLRALYENSQFADFVACIHEMVHEVNVR